MKIIGSSPLLGLYVGFFMLRTSILLIFNSRLRFTFLRLLLYGFFFCVELRCIHAWDPPPLMFLGRAGISVLPQTICYADNFASPVARRAWCSTRTAIAQFVTRTYTPQTFSKWPALFRTRTQRREMAKHKGLHSRRLRTADVNVGVRVMHLTTSLQLFFLRWPLPSDVALPSLRSGSVGMLPWKVVV